MTKICTDPNCVPGRLPEEVEHEHCEGCGCILDYLDPDGPLCENCVRNRDTLAQEASDQPLN